MFGEVFKVFAVFSLIDEATRPLKQISQGFDNFEKKLQKVSESFNKISQQYTELGKSFIAGGAGLVAGFVAPVKAAADFQEAMADVNKVANFTTKEYTEFSTKLLKLSEVIPLAVEDLAALAAAGAQMGVAKKDLLYFTETVAKLATAFDMPAGQIGDIMGKLANVFKIPITQIGKLGDAINELSNNMAASAPAIVEVLSRIGGTAASINMTAQEASALGAALLALGETPERAGTALNDMLNTLANLSVQPKKVKDAIEELGFSADELETEIREKPIPTLLKFFETLKASGEASKYLNLIFGIEPGPKLIKLINNTDELRKALRIVSNEANYAGSAQKEFEARAATLNNQLSILKNSFRHIAIAMGTVFLPPFTKAAQVVAKALSSVAEFAEKHKILSKVLLGTVGAIGIFLVGIGSGFLLIGMFAKGVSTAIEGLIQFKRAITIAWQGLGILRVRILSNIRALWSWITAQWASVRASIAQAGGLRALSIAYLGRLLTGIRTAVGAVWSFNAALWASPITWIIAGIVGVAGALYFLQKRFAILSKVWEKIKVGINWLKTHWQSVLKIFLWVNPITAPIVALNKLVQFVSGINLFEAGKKILLTLVDGIKAVALKPYEVVKSALSKVRKLLPFSPAKEGPLSDLDIAGKKLLDTVATNVKADALVNQTTKALTGVKKVFKNFSVPVKWITEHLKLPSLKEMTVPIRWVMEHLRLPDLSALSVPVKWMTEQLKLPNLEQMQLLPEKREVPRRFSEKIMPFTVNLHLTQNIEISGEGEPEKIKSAIKSTTRDFEEAVYRALMRVLERNRRLSFAGEA